MPNTVKKALSAVAASFPVAVIALAGVTQIQAHPLNEIRAAAQPSGDLQKDQITDQRAQNLKGLVLDGSQLPFDGALREQRKIAVDKCIHEAAPIPEWNDRTAAMNSCLGKFDLL